MRPAGHRLAGLQCGRFQPQMTAPPRVPGAGDNHSTSFADHSNIFFALKSAVKLVYSDGLGTLGISEQRTKSLRRIRL